MRYDERIRIVIDVKKEEYDPVSGEYVDGIAEELVLPADVTDLGIRRSTELFGEYRVGGKIARIQQPYDGPVNYISYKLKTYKVIARVNDNKGFYMYEDSI